MIGKQQPQSDTGELTMGVHHYAHIRQTAVLLWSFLPVLATSRQPSVASSVCFSVRLRCIFRVILAMGCYDVGG